MKLATSVLALTLLTAGAASAQEDAATLLARADEKLAKFEQTAGRIPQMQTQLQQAQQSGDQARFAELKKQAEALDTELKGIIKEAVGLYEQTLQVDPSEGRAYTGLGALKLSTGDLDAGSADLEKAIALRPDHIPSYYYRATVRFGRMDYPGSLEDSKKVVAANYKVDRMKELQITTLAAVHDFAGVVALLDEIVAANGSEQAKQYAKTYREYQTFLAEENRLREAEAKAGDLPRVKFVTDKGEIVIELFENEAPNTVANFVSLVEKGFYDGIRFHRVIAGFMAQGGDPNSKDADPANDGQGGPGYKFADELAGAIRKHFSGSLSMANAGPNTNGSQFFITFVPTWHLNGRHTVFGRVAEGMDVVYQLRKGTTIQKAMVLRKREHAYQPKKLD